MHSDNGKPSINACTEKPEIGKVPSVAFDPLRLHSDPPLDRRMSPWTDALIEVIIAELRLGTEGNLTTEESLKTRS